MGQEACAALNRITDVEYDKLAQETDVLWSAIGLYIDMVYDKRITGSKAPRVPEDEILFHLTGQQDLSGGRVRKFAIKIPKDVVAIMQN